MSAFAWAMTALSLIGVWFNIKHNPIGFIFWIVANVGWVYIDYQAGLYSQSILFFVYTVLAAYGFYEWKYKNGK